MKVPLIIGASLSAIAALLHLGCIFFGASWYRFFGAGEHMATLAEQGSKQPTLITLFIFFTLITWSLYGFSAAGIIIKLPFIKTMLTIITSIYLLRGVAGFFFMSTPLGRSPEFWLWSSIICFIIGIFHFIGLKYTWHNL